MRSPVQRCAEWRRVDALPRREHAIDDATIDAVTAMLLRPEARGTIDPATGQPYRLRAIQVAALLEIVHCGGMLGPIRVGAGKTLITFLAPTIAGAERPVLLVPAKLREKTIREYVAASRAWLVHPRLVVDAYEMQSRVTHAERLLERAPDCLIFDEAHRVKNPMAAVTMRVARYIESNRPRVIAVSGTLLRASIRDAATISAWALSHHSPFPRSYGALETWGAALDQARDPAEDIGEEAGALRAWSDGRSSVVRALREGFRDRVRSAPGVIATTDDGPAFPLTLDAWTPPVPRVIADALAELADGTAQRTPDGRDIEDPLRLADARNALALGFWYRWRVEPPRQWLHTRRLWAWFVRSVIRSTDLDSVHAVALACGGGSIDVPTCRAILEEREESAHGWEVNLDAPIASAWRAIEPTFTPETEPVWLTDEIVHAAAQWARDTGGIVWTRHAAFGNALHAIGVDYYGAGGVRTGDPTKRPIEHASGPIAASIGSNSEGRNLQVQGWSRMLHTALRAGKASAAECEQTIARVHRDGFTGDAVHVSVMLAHQHQVAAFESTMNGARWLHQIQGQPQKLTTAINLTGHA